MVHLSYISLSYISSLILFDYYSDMYCGSEVRTIDRDDLPYIQYRVIDHNTYVVVEVIEVSLFDGSGARLPDLQYKDYLKIERNVERQINKNL